MGRSRSKRPCDAKHGKRRYVTEHVINMSCFAKRDDIEKLIVYAEKNPHV